MQHFCPCVGLGLGAPHAAGSPPFPVAMNAVGRDVKPERCMLIRIFCSEENQGIVWRVDPSAARQGCNW
eukprot:scaffold684_cov345-Pavlova_lutheri.AAC.30